MKRYVIPCLVLAVAIVVGIFGYRMLLGQEPVELAEVTVPAETQEIPTTEAPTEPVVTEPAPTGTLLLSVSHIDFSLVGESEDVYLGTVPAEAVTWEIEDPAVATFENGVLTAVGVGTTTARAIFGDQMLECQVGCLAQTQEELDKLDAEILTAPKRYPPEVDESATEFFADAAIVGDSISYVLFQYETKNGGLGHPLFLVRGGSSLFGFVLRSKNVYYKGRERYMEDAVAASGVKKIFIMLGQNDLGYRSIEKTMEAWDTFLERILEKSPDVEVYLQSCTPEWRSLREDDAQNDVLAEYNLLLEEYAQEHGYHFVEIASYVVDHTGRMSDQYNMDKRHMNNQGCAVWIQALNTYAYQQQIIEGDLA